MARFPRFVFLGLFALLATLGYLMVNRKQSSNPPVRPPLPGGMVFNEGIPNSLPVRSYDEYHIVSAQHNNSLKMISFLDKIPKIHHTIQRKNENGVPNVGNEATSYLHYILLHYDTMPKNVIFVHDQDESWHHYGKISQQIYAWISLYEGTGSTYYEFNEDVVIKTNGEIVQRLIQSPSILTKDYKLFEEVALFREYYTTLLQPTVGSYKEVQPTTGKCCAQFIVSKARILIRSKQFYQAIYDWLLHNTDGQGNGDRKNETSGWMTGRYLEFTWRFIFNGDVHTASRANKTTAH